MSQRGDRAGQTNGWRPSGRQIVAVIGVVIVLIFAIANLEDANIDFVVGDVTLPLFFVIVGAALLGAIAGWLFGRHVYRND